MTWRHGVVVWLVALMAAATLLTAEYWRAWWAWSFLRYVPWSLRLTATAMVMAATAVPCRRWAWLAKWAGRHNRLPWYLLPLAGLFFWLLRERTYRGDALLKLHLLETRTLQTDPYVWKEPLESFLAYGLSRWLPADVAVALLSVLAGVVYIAVVLLLARYLDLEATEQAVLVIGLLALGSSQLWFGHVENYSLVTAISTASVALALHWLDQRRKAGIGSSGRPSTCRKMAWPVAIGMAAGAAVSLHPQAAFILPALLMLPERGGQEQQVGWIVLGCLAVLLSTVAVMRGWRVPWPGLVEGFAGDPQLFWAPSQALSPDQLLDALNNLWLVAPLAPFLMSAGIAGLLCSPLRRDRRFQYLSVLAGGLLVYHFFFQNDLPRPRDWDLFAIVGPVLTLWGLYAWLRLSSPSYNFAPELRTLFRHLLIPALAFALVMTAAWVGVNHAYTLLQPDPDQRELYVRYRLLDLTELLPQASVVPAEPFCSDPVTDPTGCQRVTLTSFTMPQDGDTRPVIFAHAPASITLPLVVPQTRTFLWLSPALDPLAWGWGGDGVTFQVRVQANGTAELLWSRHLTPTDPGDRDWQEIFLPLDRWQGQEIRVVLETLPGSDNDSSADRAGWGLAWLMQGTVEASHE